MPPLDPNNDLLRVTLESLPLLDGRFANIRLVNWDPVRQIKQGCFSLVFRADDVVDDRPVALKFYDISTATMLDQYRRASFTRENAILLSLLNESRCLQLSKGLSAYQLPVPMPGGSVVTIPCEYFAVEWLADEVGSFFLDPQHAAHTVIDKLKLYNEVVLAVEALHRAEVFHRDIKADNLRACQRALKRVVVAIDLGTAARFDSGCLASGYPIPAGSPAYSAPEAICGLAGNRLLAPRTDDYALGCLLYELFNQDYFFRRLLALNAQINARWFGMKSMVSAHANEAQQVKQWRAALDRYAPGITPATIDAPGSAVPPGVVPELNEILGGLTNVDYARRPDLRLVREKVWRTIRLLESQNAYNRRLAYVREMRRRRQEKARQLDIRFNRRPALSSRKC
jgi:serine/threonine protein kinase